MELSPRQMRIFWLSAILLLGFQLMGIVLPENFWGTHFWGLLPSPAREIFGVLLLACFSAPFWWPRKPLISDSAQLSKRNRTLIFLAGGGIMAAFYGLFPIYQDFYGDSYYIRQAVDITIPQWDNRLILEPMTPDFLDTKVGLKTWYQVNNFFTWLTGANGVAVAKTIGMILGGLFGFLWMKFVDTWLTRPGWKLLFIAVGLTAPATQVFAGHFETYAFSYTAILIWFSALGIFFRKPDGKRRFWPLVLLFLVVEQTHITNLLLLPSLFLAAMWHFRGKSIFRLLDQLDGRIRKIRKSYEGGFSWSGAVVYIFLPAALVLMVAYFFIWGNHDGPRKFTEEEFENTLFLPLYTDEPAPYDRYNLFSLSHLLDYLNLILMYSSGLILLLLPVITFFRRKLPWKSPMLLVTGVTLVLMLPVFFLLNPLLSPAIDFDLFITPALVALPFAVVAYHHLEDKISLGRVAGPVLGLSLCSFLFLFTNAFPNLLADHLQFNAKHQFKTYWIGCSTDLIGSTQLGRSDKEAQVNLQDLIGELEPFAVMGNDKEYAALLLEAGSYIRKTEKRADLAAEYFRSALRYSPNFGTANYEMMVNEFLLEQYDSAYHYVKVLVRMKYPPYKETLKKGIHVSLAAKQYQSAADYAVTYLNRWQDDPAISEVERRLRTGDRIDTLIELFGQ